MPTKGERENLQRRVSARRRAVTAKQARIKREIGVDVRAAGYDPRRDPKLVKRYNTRQLEKYLNDLDSFMSRKNNFVAGANNVPIPKVDWNNYKKVEAQYNRIGAKHFGDIADIFLPTSGMTVRQRDRTLVPDAIHAQGTTVNRPYSPTDKRPGNIKSAQALKKLTDDIRRKTKADFLPSQIKKARAQLKQMLDIVGSGELKDMADKLTDHQFDILWNYTQIAQEASGIYYIMQHQSAEATQRSAYDSVVENYSDDIRELLIGAQKFPESAESPRSTNGTAKNNQKGKAAQKAPRRGR